MATSSEAKQKSNTQVKSDLQAPWDGVEARGPREATALTAAGLLRLRQWQNLDGRIAGYHMLRRGLHSPALPKNKRVECPLVDWLGW